jgi:RNA polymerase sigma-70 factor (ECF subfamily)
MTADSAQFAGKAGTRDDLDLVHATQDGDVSAFEELVERYDRRLLRIAEHITHNREDSQDAVQEAFLKAFQHLGDFREDSRFSTWLFRITVNQALMKLRTRCTTTEVSLDDDFQADGDIFPREVADWAPNPERLYRTSELRDILIKVLEELRPILRTVFVLRDIEAFSIDQTAEVLDLSPTAVKARLFRARLQLRELLSEYFSEHKELAGVQARPGTASPRKVGLLGKAYLRLQENTT